MTLKNAFGDLNLEATQQQVLTAVTYSEFSRIEDKRFKDTEEVRFDIPTILSMGSIYVGVATDGADEAAATWTVIRTYFNTDKLPVRKRIRFNMSWQDRTVGW